MFVALISWVTAHWQSIGVGIAVITLLYKVGRFFAGVGLSIKSFIDDVTEAKATLNTIATNHLAHMQDSMQSVSEGIADLQITSDATNEHLIGLRGDIANLERTTALLVVSKHE